MNDNKILQRLIEDKYIRFNDYCVFDNSDFLSLEEQSLLARFVATHRKEGVFFFGGYMEAERKQICFVPEYLNLSDENALYDYFLENADICPFAVLNIKIPSQEKKSLNHRDYLGALMGEGIKREKVGDIIVGEKGAKIVVAKEMANFLADNYRQVGSVSVVTTIEDLASLKSVELKIEEKRLNVSSTRLDNVISAVFDISRKNATEEILRGRVFVNGIEQNKPDYFLKGGEKLVLRGKGKAIYKGEVGTSKKGKVYIFVQRYV